MIRAVIFDFYSVWTPDKLTEYTLLAEKQNPMIAQKLQQIVQQYYLGITEIDYVSDSFRYNLNTTALPPDLFKLNNTDIAPALIDFMRYLHSHFLKLGVLANIGKQEYAILSDLNAKYQLFEVIVGSLNAGALVYSREVIAKALNDIGEPPGSCLVVTGSIDYLHAAEACGIQVLRFEGFPKLKTALDQVIENG